MIYAICVWVCFAFSVFGFVFVCSFSSELRGNHLYLTFNLRGL